MDSRQAAVLLVVLLLLTGWGHAEGPGGQGGEQIFLSLPVSLLDVPVLQEEDAGPRTPQDAQAPASLFLSLLQAMQRPGRGPAFPFQPQRFGRNAQGSRSNERLSIQAGEGLSSPFWSLAAPQRFGKK